MMGWQQQQHRATECARRLRWPRVPPPPPPRWCGCSTKVVARWRCGGIMGGARARAVDTATVGVCRVRQVRGQLRQVSYSRCHRVPPQVGVRRDAGLALPHPPRRWCHSPHAQARRARERQAYATLGLGRGATEAEIKSAFRSLAKQHHPDLSAASAAATGVCGGGGGDDSGEAASAAVGSAEAMAALAAAYDVLMGSDLAAKVRGAAWSKLAFHCEVYTGAPADLCLRGVGLGEVGDGGRAAADINTRRGVRGGDALPACLPAALSTDGCPRAGCVGQCGSYAKLTTCTRCGCAWTRGRGGQHRRRRRRRRRLSRGQGQGRLRVWIPLWGRR
jgi:DnaJ-domain-containing protein 1